MLLGVGLGHADAQAANGVTPRTRPVFFDAQCLSVVDRSVDPVFHLDIAIPFEDLETTSDELDDSRRFEFFAVCSDPSLAEPLPSWTRVSDVERAADAGLLSMEPSDSDVLESSSQWSGCAISMMPDGQRMPISCAATRPGLQWDTRGVPAGNYTVWGYTFEPPINVWEPRPGVVQVVDDPELAPPVANLLTPAVEGQRVYLGDEFAIRGCGGGPAGTTITLSWISVIELGRPEANWTSFAEIDLSGGASQGDFEVVFEPPAEAKSQSVVVRAVARAASGESWTAYAPGTLLVVEGDGESDTARVPEGPDYCEADETPEEGSTGTSSGGEAEPSGSSGSSTSPTSAGGDANGSSGCGCMAGSEEHPIVGLLTGWLVVLTARRRRNDLP